MKKLLESILSFLRVRVPAAGVEVADEVVRLVYFDGKAWQLEAIRLEPGVLEGGKIKNRPALLEALAALKAKLHRRERKKIVNIVLCLSAVPTYTQVFALPVVQGADLARAAELNLQMTSPLEAGEAYSGWEVVGQDEGTSQAQVLAAFIDRKVVDEMVGALYDAGFLTMAVEPRALALTRMLNEKGAGIDVGKSYVFVSIDNSGCDFFIIRKGALYFEYAKPWRDLMDEKGEVTIPKFQESFAASIRQVINFYTQHWPEPISAIILSAVALGNEAEKVIADAASVPAVRLTLVMGQPISSEWLTALGCSLRRTKLKAKDHEVSLLGEDLQDRFREEQFLHFMRFWRVVVPVTLCLLVLTFAVADAFLASTRSDIESRSDFNLNNSRPSEITTLQAQANNFNQMVALVGAAESTIVPKGPALQDILSLATASHVTVNHIEFSSFSAPLALDGSAQTEDAVLAFKTALEGDPSVSGISLPLTAIQASGASVSFSMTFQYAPPAKPASQ